MANLKDIRVRINSVRTTRQVTSAMKMVSAAKLKKAQDDVEHIRPFVGKLMEVANFLGMSVDNVNERFPLFRVSQRGKILIVPIASNKGLAGAFNSNIVKETESLIRGEFRRDIVDIMPIGKQLTKGLASRGITTKGNFNDLLDNVNQATVAEIANRITAEFCSGKYREVHLVYNEFVNAAVQNVVVAQMLPLSLLDDKENCKYSDYIVEPDKGTVLEAIVPQVVVAKLYSTILESLASEHGARMTSMHKATDNATELLSELQLQYNKARQAAITNELIEIVSGAEALNS